MAKRPSGPTPPTNTADQAEADRMQQQCADSQTIKTHSRGHDGKYKAPASKPARKPKP